MTHYLGRDQFRHDSIPAVGVLVANLGTPEAPTARALRPYLKEFLSDPRVIEPPPARWLWRLILNGIVLNTRPKRSARLYRNIWTERGSPLLETSRQQVVAIAAALTERIGAPLHVALGMRYGRPSIASALAELESKDCRRVLVLPLYPQYSGATTGSTFDAVADALKATRWVPELRFVNGYHDDPAYIAALAAGVREAWDEHGRPDRLLISFHGIPRRYFLAGDPYHCQCHKTARLLAEALELPEEERYVCFQSQFGKEPWLEPYTEQTIREWAGLGLKRFDAICPGFSADCLETLEEMNITNREIYNEAGGGDYHYIPCLNTRPDHIASLVGVIERNLVGWVGGTEEHDPVAQEAEANKRTELYRKLEGVSPNVST